ncbi:MAG: stage V sporulation protein AC [Clostridia bacterium]|nr:stage V sporulation protein AC [Clostridia bacterium]
MEQNKNLNIKYNAYVEAKIPKTKMLPSLLKAFLVGGLICAIGQGFFDLYTYFFPYLSEAQVSSAMLITIVFLASLLTGIGIYDRIGAFGGAGSVIPITGFSNSIASPALEYKKEGIIFGMCVKMFSVAGPVIVNGVVASIIAGLIYWIF